MARGKKHAPEQVVNLLRQIEVAVANGNLPGASFEAESPEDCGRWQVEGRKGKAAPGGGHCQHHRHLHPRCHHSSRPGAFDDIHGSLPAIQSNLTWKRHCCRRAWEA
jgi:hypothetical protein